MKVLTVGDFCPQNRVAELFDKGEYKTVLDSVKKVISNVDYSIVNFECPVAENFADKIKKNGPSLQCSESGVQALKWVGFNGVTLANNHFLDFGDVGAKNTLTACSKYGIETVGGGMNLLEASKVLYKEIRGKILAIINCCEHEFSIATVTTAGANPLNPIQQYYAIKEARKRADYILLIVHGGHELWQLPSPRMVETYRFFVDAGADAVVNHHQHCFSGYEYYKGKPIVYGLGNFCFDKQGYFEGLWEYGYMVMIDFANDIEMTILPYQQCKENPQIEFIKDTGSFDEKIQELNNIISSKDELNRHTKSYYSKQLQSVSLAFEPYRGRVLNKLYLKGWLPSFLRKGKLVKLRNMIENESHRDKTLFFLTN